MKLNQLVKLEKLLIANPGMLKDNGAILIDIKDGSNYDLSLISLDE